MPRRTRRRDDEPLGVLYVDKPAGPTSAEVCDFLRWALRTRSVGHCGTLDPGATGLLVCCVGAATKLVPLLTDDDKTYRGRFVLGRSTTTADAAGEVLTTAEVGADAWGRALAVLEGLVGAHELSPPAFSAVRIDGERAHEKARRGEDVSLPVRTMTVFTVREVREVERGVAEATLRVSKGSFIRSLAVEWGRQLGLPAHLGALHRVGSGRCSLQDAKAVAGFDVSPMPPRPDGKPRHRIRVAGVGEDRQAQADHLSARLVEPAEVLGVPALELSRDAHGEDLARRIGHGQSVACDHPALDGVARQGSILLRAGAGRVLCRFEGEGDSAVLRISRTLRPLAFEGPRRP
ncbi:MAG: tRNA pseudouridine(55) synthase TruB [Nannocystaceae bacterium]|nr:tRNA pseudouridine(55) synthase TruB [bacterium]